MINPSGSTPMPIGWRMICWESRCFPCTPRSGRRRRIKYELWHLALYSPHCPNRHYLRFVVPRVVDVQYMASICTALDLILPSPFACTNWQRRCPLPIRPHDISTQIARSHMDPSGPWSNPFTYMKPKYPFGTKPGFLGFIVSMEKGGFHIEQFYFTYFYCHHRAIQR